MLEVYIYGIWSSVIRNLYHFFRELVPNHVEPFLMEKNLQRKACAKLLGSKLRERRLGVRLVQIRRTFL